MPSFWQTLSRVFRIGRARYLVGKDLADNAYYEFPSPSGSTDPRHTRRYEIPWLTQCDQVESVETSVGVQPQRRAYSMGRMDAPHKTAGTKYPGMWLTDFKELVKDLERQRIVLHNAQVLESREQAARVQAEDDRQETHRQAIAEQQAREKQRLEQMQAAAADADPELVAQRAEAAKQDIESASFKPARRGQ